MRILLTGSAGYIARVLFLEKLLGETNVDGIVGIDILPQSADIHDKKLFWIKHDLSKHGWEEPALQRGPFDVIVHLAFKIRSPYGKVKETAEENLALCKNVFDFAFKNKIPRLIYSSSVAAYGASEDNIGILLKETTELKEKKSPYGVQKKEVEKLLFKMLSEVRPETDVSVLRLGSVTGPIGQNLKSKSISLISFMRKILPFIIEADPSWARQFVHEKDVAEVIWKLIYPVRSSRGVLNPAFATRLEHSSPRQVAGYSASNGINSSAKKGGSEIYNIAPPNFLTARDMAKLLKKFVIKTPKPLIKPLFGLAWNLTLGRIPTHPDSSAGLIYPINVDGSKIKGIGFRYRYTAEDAFLARL